MRKSLTKAVMLGTLALTQTVGTVAMIQNSIVSVYAEQKNKRKNRRKTIYQQVYIAMV